MEKDQYKTMQLKFQSVFFLKAKYLKIKEGVFTVGPHFTLITFLQLANRLHILPVLSGTQAFGPDNMFMFFKD